MLFRPGDMGLHGIMTLVQSPTARKQIFICAKLTLFPDSRSLTQDTDSSLCVLILGCLNIIPGVCGMVHNEMNISIYGLSKTDALSPQGEPALPHPVN